MRTDRSLLEHEERKEEKEDLRAMNLQVPSAPSFNTESHKRRQAMRGNKEMKTASFGRKA